MYLAYKYIKNKRAQRSGPNNESAGTPTVAGPCEPDPVDGGCKEPAIPPTAETPSVREATAAEKHHRRVYRWKLIAGLVLPSFLAAVDSTIVAPAFPTIASAFDKLGGQLNWIVTAYTLTSTTFIPAFGQLADIFGRHAALQISLAFMLVGSVLCAAAQSWGMLLVGRALQGVSAAGITDLVKIVLADGVSLEDNSKNNTLFSLLAGVSFAVGPVVGGYLTSASWRYCFVLSIPITVISQLLIFFVLRKELKRGSYNRKMMGIAGFRNSLATIDCFGALLFIFGAGLLVLGITWGGSTYSWGSGAVLAPTIIGGLIFIGFFVWEYLFEPGRPVARLLPRQTPMIPWSLFDKKDAFLLAVINFATGAALYSAFYFISIYWNLAEGLSPSDAGVQLLYYTPGLGVGVYLAMFLCNTYPAQTFLPLLTGTVTECLGLSLLTWAVTTRHKPLVNGVMALAGVGTGLRFMPVSLHGAGIWGTRIAAIMSLLGFFVPFGGTLSIGIMTSVFTNKFDKSLSGIMASASAGNTSSITGIGGGVSTSDLRGSVQNLDAINSLPSAVRDKIRDAAAKAVMWAFISILPFMALSVVAAACLGNVWIKTKSKADSNNGGEGVLYGSYLGALITRTVQTKKQPVERHIPSVAAEQAEQEKLTEQKVAQRGISSV